MQVRTCRNLQKCDFYQDFSFLQVRTCRNFRKCTLTKILSFLQFRTCQNFQKCSLIKISHFCRSGPVEISENVLGTKLLIFARPDLSKFAKMYFDQNFEFLQVRTCQNFQKHTLTKISHICRSGPVKIFKNIL